VVDASGEIADMSTKESIRKFVEGFVAHLRAQGRGR
jgi:hypothetical protein